MDHFSALRAFVVVVEEGSFVAAAGILGVAVSSVTRQVTNLESHLGVQLLNRSTRSVTVTDAGNKYYVDAIRILDDMAEANRNVMEAGQGPRGLLRVSAPSAFARLHIAPFISDYLAKYPDIELDLVISDAVINLAEERMDIAIRIGEVEGNSLIARKLAPHRRILCASEGYLEKYGTPQSPEDLKHHNCLTFASRTGGRNWKFERGDEEITVKVKGALRANNSELLRESALAGTGIILSPDWLVGCDITKGELKPLLPDWAATPGTKNGAVNAVYLQSHRGSQKITSFVEFLKERFGPVPYWRHSLEMCRGV